MIPERVRALFWKPSTPSSVSQYPECTIFRILELGDRPHIAWLRANFSEEQIKNVIRNERGLSPRLANFWAHVYGIPLEEVAALRE